MAKKVVLFLVDGMRPDALAMVNTPVMDSMMQKGMFTLTAQTVMPSVTLPSHMSLFFSSVPGRHGILTNTFTPMVRPIPSLFDVLHNNEYKTASFTNWEQLRDLSAPGSLTASFMLANLKLPFGQADVELTQFALSWLTTHECDFSFLYLGQTDEVGHKYGWLSDPYLLSIDWADRCMGMVMQALGSNVNYFVTADHGGHDQHHGSPMPEDMTIPFLAMGPDVPARGEMAGEVSIMDIAPTILNLFGCRKPDDWFGRDLLAE